jgi:hypothetical protein
MLGADAIPKDTTAIIEMPADFAVFRDGTDQILKDSCGQTNVRLKSENRAFR